MMLSDDAAAVTDLDELIVRPAFGRLAASHIGQLLLDRGLRWQAALEVDRVDTVIIQAVISASMAHLPLAAAGLDAPTARRRSVSILSVSSSMGLSYETTRRRFLSLDARGLLDARHNGYVVPTSDLICGAPHSLAVQDSAALYALFDRMRRQGFRDLPAVTMAGDHARVGRAIIDFAVRSLEGFAEQHGSITAGSIWAAIIAANVRDLLSRETMPDGYADASQPLPDRERKPVSLRQVAVEVNLPFETVRRHVMAMSRRGTVAIGKQGAIVPASALVTPQQIARSRLNIGYLRRLFDSVGAAQTRPR